MKKLVLFLALALGTSINAQTKGFENFRESDGFDLSKGFDVNLFQKYLTQEMYLAFPWMTEDTTNNFAARATDQKEAGSPMCYGTKKGGMVDYKSSEILEAKRIVKEYKNHVFNNLHFDEKSLKKCGFTEFSAVATKQYGGLIRYGIIIDNNITEEDLIIKLD